MSNNGVHLRRNFLRCVVALVLSVAIGNCTDATGPEEASPPMTRLDQPRASAVVTESRWLDAGAYHTCAVRNNGTVVCWGSNSNGQGAVPAGLSNVTQIGAGGFHNCALKSDGTVTCWGLNHVGQSNVPAGLSSVTSISVGSFHNCALKSDHTVVCWGANGDGESNVPAGLSQVVSISAGGAHTCAVKLDGTAVCWGRNNFGQSTIPSDLSTIVQISTGAEHTCALQTDHLNCWGRNDFGQGQSVSVNPRTVVQIAAGAWHNCAVTDEGLLRCWGSNDSHQKEAPPLDPFVSVAAGTDHSCAAMADGTVMCWGDDSFGQSSVPAGLTLQAGSQAITFTSAAPSPGNVGDSYTVTATGGASGNAIVFNSYTPEVCDMQDSATVSLLAAGTCTIAANQAAGNGYFAAEEVEQSFQIIQPLTIPALTPQLSGGDDLACALKIDGSVVCWGGNAIQPPAGSSFVQISSGGLHSCGLKSDGTITCWGQNNFGQNNVPSGLGTIVQVVAGYNHTCALKDDGTVACWGQNTLQQLAIPAGLSSVTQISTSASHTCARQSDGLIVCWGDNSKGQATVPPLKSGDRVLAGGYHTCAELSGNASCWGEDDYNQLKFATLKGNSKFELGYHFTCRLNNEKVDCWGDNSRGQTTVPQLSDSVMGLSVGGYHACVFDNDGVVTCWALGRPVPAGLNLLGKQAQTITFTSSAPNPGHIGGSYNVSATGGPSGNPVMFKSLTPSVCGVSGSSVALISIGQCTIAANQMGSAQYVTAPQTTQTFDVAPELTRIPSVGAGGIHSCALQPDGSVVCWGADGAGGFPVPGGLGDVVQLSVGTGYACVLKSNSTVACWGANGFGETIPPANLSGVTQVSAGGKMTCVLKFDGSVLCWGSETDGELVPPAGLNALYVSAGGDAFGCALKTDHTVVCWGFGGDGRTTVPAGLANVQQISAGAQHACAVTTSGMVACWGPNPDGRTSVPQNLTNVQQVSAGGGHTCALKSDGTVVCWGANADGQATPPANLTSVQQIDAGQRHTCARRIDAKIVCWGWNGFNQTIVPSALAPVPQAITITSTPPNPATIGATYSVAANGGASGNAVTFTSLTPNVCNVSSSVVSLVGPGTCTVSADQGGGNGYDPAPRVTQSFNVIVPLVIPQLAAQISNGGFHTCAARIDGTVSCWGRNIDGQSTVPSSLSSVAMLSGGGYHTCAIKSDGTVACWGLNDLSQSSPPAGLSSVAKISAGSFHTCAIKTDGTLVCWGWNALNQIAIPNNLGPVIAVGAGDRHTCAVKADGTVACWGSNETNQTIVPDGLSGVIDIASGSYHSCALKSNGTVVCWGTDGHGQLSAPASLSSVVQIAAGARYSCARKSDGSIVCWGSNDEGQQIIPAAATNLAGITTGYFHTCVLRDDGTPVCWGRSDDGQIAVPAGLNLLERTQRISFATAPAPAVLGTSFTASATGGASGSAVTFTSSTPATCTVSGSQVSLIALGPCTIAANQAGAPGYAPAPQVVQTFEVSSPFNMLSRCGHAITGIAFDGSDYFVGEGHDGLDQCVTRYTGDGVLVSTKHFLVDIRGLHFVPALGLLTSRTWAGQLSTMNYSTGAQQALTGFVAALGVDQSQPAVDPDGVSFWVLDVPGQAAQRRRVSDNAVISSFAITGGRADAPAVAVSDVLVFVPNGLMVRGYDKVTGDLVSTITLPTSAEGCNGYGFGAAASGDRLMYSQTCRIAHVHMISPPGSQTIAFTSTAPSGALIGGTYSLSATGGASGIAVTYESSTQGVCTISASQVSFIGAGTCTVVARQRGGNGYLHADDATQSFTVSKLPQTITFSSPPDPALLLSSYTPTVTATSGQSITLSASGACSMNGTAVEFVSIGHCTVSASVSGSAVYLPASSAQGFNVIYAFTGFGPPVANVPAVNSAKAGSVVKVQFSLGGNHGLNVIGSGYPASGQVTGSCSTTTLPPSGQATTSADVLKYDPVSTNYTYSWQTEASYAGTCRQFVLRLDDGTVHTANFQFAAASKLTAALTVTPLTVMAGVQSNLTFVVDVVSPVAITGIAGIPCQLPPIPSGATAYKGSCVLTVKYPANTGKVTYVAAVTAGQSKLNSNSVTITVPNAPAPTVQLSANKTSLKTLAVEQIQMTVAVTSATSILNVDNAMLFGADGSECVLLPLQPGATTYNATCTFNVGPFPKQQKVPFTVAVEVEGRGGMTPSNIVYLTITK